jgi:uncharacterized repeat protein (TIGR01451 family)
MSRLRVVALCSAGLLGLLVPAQLAGAAGDPIRDVPVERLPGDDGGATTVGGSTGGGLGGGGTGTSDPPPPTSDLSITKTANHATRITGEQQVFVFTVTNAGPDPSGAPITVTDQLPAGMTFFEDAGSWECSANGQTVTCLRGPLTAGESDSQLAIVATVGADAAPTGTLTTQTNTASVTGPNADSNSANNASSASYDVFPVSDLTTSKTHTGAFTVGFYGTWTITVHNEGPGFAPGGVFVADQLPDGFEFVQTVGDANGWDCRPDGPAQLGKFACEHAGALGLGDSQFTARVFVTPEATPDGVAAQATNNASVVEAGNETDELNNSSTDTADVNPSADLELTKSHSGNFTHGQHGTYTLGVTNNGSAVAAGPITVMDSLPTGWGYIASGSGGNGWSCDGLDVPPMPNQPRNVVCTHAGDLASGAQVPFPLVVVVPSDLAATGPAFGTNTAFVTSPTPDPDLQNNSSFDVTRVVDAVSPLITVPGDITTSNDPGLATAAVTYTPTATDNYPGVTVSCNPPSGTAFPLGKTPVTCTATDTSGNTDSDSFDVTVNDAEPPSVTVPTNITKANDPGLATAVVTYTATASDNAPGVTLACVPPSASAFPIGPTTVTCTATDGSGNTASKSFTVTVVDSEPPSLTVPANMTVNATKPSGAAVSFTTTAADNAPGVMKACVPSSGSTFAIGTTTVNCTATDASGNTASKSFQITVLGAVDQLNNLVNRVKGTAIEPGYKSELLNRLNSALSALNVNSKTKACQELAKFLDGVKSKAGKKMSAADAAALTGDATRIRSVLGC